MAFHRSLQITEDLRRIFNSKTGEMLNNVIPDSILPVIPITPVCKIVRNGVATNAVSTTFFTTATNKDFYMVAASLAVIKDANSTSITTTLTASINGVFRIMLQIPTITLTAQNNTINLNFNPPIKIDRNTGIAVQNTTAIAVIVAAACITGYEVESDPSPQS